MGGKNKKTTVGYWYKPAFHAGLGIGPIDAFLQFRGGDKPAWSGVLTASGTISINAPNLWGGEKDQGGIVGDVDVMFGEADQQPNGYLASVFGEQQSAWRGLSTLVFKGGKYGAMNPYPQKASYKIRRIAKGWDGDGCWYEENAAIPFGFTAAPVSGPWPWVNRSAAYFVVGASEEYAGTFQNFNGWWHGNIDCFRITKGVCRYATNTYDVPNEPFGDALTDPHYSNVVLLMRMEGAEGSTAFTDDKGHAVTAFNGAHITTARSRFGSSSAYFNGIDSYLIANMGSPDKDLGSVWTMEAWVWLESVRETDFATYGRAIFGFGALNIGWDDTAWFCNGSRWNFCQREAASPGGDQPYLVQNIGPRAQVGRWAFVSVCYDGENYWMHQDGQLLMGTVSESLGINPAHILYYSRTHADMGREPPANIDATSFMAAADWYWSQGFALCTSYDPSAESVEEFEQRICRVAGCSLTRSLIDGKWYLDVANGEYDLESLPILTDDDILEFQEQPTLLDSAVNSVSIKYFDPDKKEAIVTPPVQAPALISDFGTNHLTIEYLEIPTGSLATRVAQRELMARVTPLRGFPLKTTRKPYAWRPSTYFRLQAPKRGIADMVCIFSEKSSGQLRSGAMSISATQDVYSVPSAAFVGVEDGVDTTPNQTPAAITQQRAFEAPYIDTVASMSNADFAALDVDAGFLMAVAADPVTSRNYTMVTGPSGGPYTQAVDGEWCPTGIVAAGADKMTAAFTLASGKRLSEVEVGSAALWDDEILRVDAINPSTGEVTFGRGCADTVPAAHAPGSRVWFYGVGAAADLTEYTAGETVGVKLLTNTGSQQLPVASATEMTVVFAQRIRLPYPPAKVKVASADWPATVSGAFDLTWAHRNLASQADQLIDTTAASIAPADNVRYGLRFRRADTHAVLVERSDIGPGTATVTLNYAGDVEMELWTISDQGASLQKQTHTFAYTPPGGSPTNTITATAYTPVYGGTIIDGGDLDG